MSTLLPVAVTVFVTASLTFWTAAKRLERRHPMLFGRAAIGIGREDCPRGTDQPAIG